MRAVTYLPIAVWYTGIDSWFVIPPHEVVCAVSTKVRGQHTENAFESATLNLAAFGAFQVAEAEVRAATLRAVEEGDRYQELRVVMTEIVAQSRELATASRERVRVRDVLRRRDLL